MKLRIAGQPAALALVITLAGTAVAGVRAGRVTEVGARVGKPGSSPFQFFIRNANVELQTVRGKLHADIRFETREAAHGQVDLSTRPFNDLEQIIPAGQPLATPFPAGAVTESHNDGLGAKSTAHSMRFPELTPNATYYYVVTSTRVDGRTFRYWDTFSTTPRSTVKIVFENLHAVTPVDAQVRFEITNRDPGSGKSTSRVEWFDRGEVRGENSTLRAGQDLRMDKLFIIPNALSALTLQATATHTREEETEPRKSTVSLEPDLSRHPGNNVKLPFTLITKGGDGPRFELTGRIEVVRGSSFYDLDTTVTPADAKNGPFQDILRGTKSPAPGAPKPGAVAILAARGVVLTEADPLALELRSREAGAEGRRGFEIGMAAAEGHTAPGPGKDATRSALKPEEQAGFDTAVSFSLERNRNADLAGRGAAIAKADPTVIPARTANFSVFYWLGFDIGTGLFGDPALGALGHTATGPGSIKIRDALSARAKRGFDAAVQFHLARSYKR